MLSLRSSGNPNQYECFMLFDILKSVYRQKSGMFQMTFNNSSSPGRKRRRRSMMDSRIQNWLDCISWIQKDIAECNRIQQGIDRRIYWDIELAGLHFLNISYNLSSEKKRKKKNKNGNGFSPALRLVGSGNFCGVNNKRLPTLIGFAVFSISIY